MPEVVYVRIPDQSQGQGQGQGQGQARVIDVEVPGRRDASGVGRKTWGRR